MPSKKTSSSRFKDILSSSGQAKAPQAAKQGKEERPSSARRLKTGYTQVGANIPEELKREVYKALIDETPRLSFSELVERLLQRWLAERRKHAGR